MPYVISHAGRGMSEIWKKMIRDSDAGKLMPEAAEALIEKAGGGPGVAVPSLPPAPIPTGPSPAQDDG